MALASKAPRIKTQANIRVRRSTTPERKPEPKSNARKRASAPPPPAARQFVVVGPPDPILTAVVTGLIALGVVMVYSASAVWAHYRYNDDLRLLTAQALHAAVAVPLMFVLAYVDYHRLRSVTYPFFVCAVVALGATAFGFGHSAGGAARWLRFGAIRVQPAEVAKLAVICWLAYSLSKKTAQIRSVKVGLVPHVAGCGLVMFLCSKQPDFGSAVMIALILFFMLFTAGAHLGWLFGTGLACLPLAYFGVVNSPYRMKRIAAFLAQSGAGNYQLHESQLSFGAGGITGVGIGDSHQKLLFLPEAHTDFISSIIAEELGLVGFAVLVFAFLLILYRGIRASFAAVDEYGTYLAVGITLFLATQAFTNLAVAVGVLPTKGLVLPFISYGGTSLLVNCCAVGILLNVSRPRSLTSDRPAPRAEALPAAKALGGVA